MLAALPIRSTGPSKSIALLGISCSGEDEGVSTMVMPPASCIAAKPREPSSNIPDRITPIARGLIPGRTTLLLRILARRALYLLARISITSTGLLHVAMPNELLLKGHVMHTSNLSRRQALRN